MSIVASNIFGFKLTERPVNNKVTKYDPDTGQPYEIDTTDHVELVLGEHVIATDIEDVDGTVHAESGLTIYYTDMYDEGAYILGKKLTETSDGEEGPDLKEVIIPDKLILPFEYNQEPKMYLHLYVSY